MSCSADNGIADPSIANTAEAAGLPINNDESSRLLVGRDNRAAVIRRGRLLWLLCMPSRFSIAFLSCELSGTSCSLCLYLGTDYLLLLDRLLFMTYNGMIMIAVAVGAFVGYLAFADGTPATKTIACH